MKFRKRMPLVYNTHKSLEFVAAKFNLIKNFTSFSKNKIFKQTNGLVHTKKNVTSIGKNKFTLGEIKL